MCGHGQKRKEKISILCIVCMCSFLREGVEEKRLVSLLNKYRYLRVAPYGTTIENCANGKVLCLLRNKI